MTTGIVFGGVLIVAFVIMVGVLSKSGQSRRGHATNSDGSVTMYGGGDSGCDSGSGGDCGGGDGGGGGGD